MGSVIYVLGQHFKKCTNLVNLYNLFIDFCIYCTHKIPHTKKNLYNCVIKETKKDEKKRIKP